MHRLFRKLADVTKKDKDKKEKKYLLENEDERSQEYLDPTPATSVGLAPTIAMVDLFAAAKNGDLDVIVRNVNQTNKEKKDSSGRTLLHNSAHHPGLVKHLIELGVDVNVKDANGRTPLHSAAISGNLEVIQLLFNAGALPNVRDKWMTTPQTLAVMYGNHFAATFIITGIIPITTEVKPLPTEVEIRNQFFSAAKNGDTSFIKQHVNQNNKNMADECNGKTLLHYAAEGNHTEIISYLIDLGVNLNAKDTVGYKATPLHYAAMKGCTNAIELLLKAGACIDEKNQIGETPIGVSIAWRHVAATEIFIANNADMTIRDHNGCLPFHKAIKHYSAENKEAQLKIIEVLLTRTNLDAMFYEDGKELHFLQYAAKEQQWHVVARLEKLQKQKAVQVTKEDNEMPRISLRRSC